ncbi:hypothetical protein FH972_016863 [Carpinus fangiana]|uniref:Uncharacterized protein n=1 Tax=Carpinus fangiana TaxID=176857 RepID=A0A5N6RHN7_9ROSI|nr:hypothetical protein FH972_016863 [Carpinus fangiana]
MYTDGEVKTERRELWTEKWRGKNSSETERRRGEDDSKIKSRQGEDSSETERPEAMR